MRGFLASSIGVTCAAALAFPLTPPATAATAATAMAPTARTATKTATTSTTSTTSTTTVTTEVTGRQSAPAGRAALTEPASAARGPGRAAEAPGSTQSLPLAPLAGGRTLGPGAEQGLTRRDVARFSLVGVVWDDPEAELHGRVQVRTRATESGVWSGWQDIETDNADHAADPDTAEGASGRVRGATAPLWVGDSNGVEVRVRPDAQTATDAPRTATTTSPLPSGLRLELVDPGEESAAAPQDDEPASGLDQDDEPASDLDQDDEPASGLDDVNAVALNSAAAMESATALAASAVNTELSAPLGATEIPALDREATERELFALGGGELTPAQRTKPYIGPRPRIVTRRGWGANESLREKGFVYTKKIKAAFVHHTASGNGYRCAQSPSLIRGIYRYHVRSMGWRDIGYNFLVDKCGNIYEGRAGGVAKPVMGAHTLGFNTKSMGIAVLGSYGPTKPTSATVKAIARLTAWKLGLHGANPRGKTYLKSGGGNLYRKGKKVRLNVISGHRDGFATACPGGKLYRKLGTARSTAARYQGR